MADVRSICAVGLRGQMGLNGVLPWEGDTRPEFVADVQRFFAMVKGHVLAAGPKTIGAVPEEVGREMTLFTIRSSMRPETVIERFPDRVVFIGGGPPVWDVYAPFIRHWDITRLPYDGDADRWFDPKWLVGAGRGA